jgi:hypothetical protein
MEKSLKRLFFEVDKQEVLLSEEPIVGDDLLVSRTERKIKGGNSIQKILIHGKNKTGKSSLAFQLAYEEASYGGTPLFICKKEKMQSQFPIKVEITPQQEEQEFPTSFTASVLSRIHMKYIDNLKDLLTLLSGIHIFKPAPTMLVLDDISSWIENNRNTSSSSSSYGNYHHHYHQTTAAAGPDPYLLLLGFIDDAVHFLQEKQPLPTLGSSSSSSNDWLSTVKVVLTDTTEEIGLIHSFQRYCDEIISLRQSLPTSTSSATATAIELKRFLVNGKERKSGGTTMTTTTTATEKEQVLGKLLFNQQKNIFSLSLQS